MSVSDLKVTTIADNLVLKPGLLGQWGLSYLIELTDSGGISRKILFDTANDRTPFLYNIEKLEMDLSGLDAIVLSHGHSDHTVATVEAVKMAGGCKVYAHPHCFLPRFYRSKDGKLSRGGVSEEQGIKEIEDADGEVILTPQPVEVVPGLWTTGQVPRINEFETVPPSTDGMRALGGFAEIYAYIGGTHLVGRPDDYVMKTTDALRKFNLKMFSPCHCTGFNAMAILSREFPEQFAVNYCGRVFKSGEKPFSMTL